MRVLIVILLLVATFTSFAKSPYKVVGNDIIVNLDGYGVKSNLLKVEMWSSSTVRVVTTMNDDFGKAPCMLGSRSEEEVDFKAAYAQNNIEISTENILISIAENGLVSLFSRDGRKLMVESDRAYNANDDGSYQIEQSFYLHRREIVYGFGQGEDEPRYNLREKEFELKQSEKSIASNVILSEKGYAFIWENYAPTKYIDTPAGMTLQSEKADDISYVFINGPTWVDILVELRKFSGDVLLLPKWAYGFVPNSLNYKSETALEEAKNKYAALGIKVESKGLDYSLYKKELEYMSEDADPQYANVWAYKNLKSSFESADHTALATAINIPSIQQYGTVSIAARNNSLKNQLAAGMVSSFTGQSYWSPQIPGENINEDQLSRWVQFAAFAPVFQSIGQGEDICDLLTKGSDAHQAVQKAINLRYRLLPYTYSTAANAVLNKSAMMRSLLFDYQGQSSCQKVNDQFLFGKDILVCPMTEATAKERSIVLPEGTAWYDFSSGKLNEGGKTIQYQPGDMQIPLFVKQGAIIPMEADSSGVGIPVLEIRVYPGADGEFVMYNDAGDGKGIRNQAYASIEFSYSEKKQRLTVESREGEYLGMPETMLLRVAFVSEGTGIGYEESENVIELEYSGKKEKVDKE